MRRKKTPYNIPVTERATIQRLNRHFKHLNRKLLSARRSQAHELGRFFVVDTAQNCLAQAHVDLETEAYRAGVLRSWERVRIL